MEPKLYPAPRPLVVVLAVFATIVVLVIASVAVVLIRRDIRLDRGDVAIRRVPVPASWPIMIAWRDPRGPLEKPYDRWDLVYEPIPLNATEVHRTYRQALLAGGWRHATTESAECGEFGTDNLDPVASGCWRKGPYTLTFFASDRDLVDHHRQVPARLAVTLYQP